MAKEKTTAESFLFDAARGKKWNIIHRQFGNDGIVIWIVLLQELTKSDNHYIIVNKVILNELAELAKVKTSQIEDFLTFFTENFDGHFNNELWNNYRIIRNEKLIEQLSTDLYSRRTNQPLTIEQLKNKYSNLTKGKLTKENSIETNLREINLSKENEIKTNLIESNLKEENIREENETKPNLTKEMLRDVDICQHHACICIHDVNNMPNMSKEVIERVLSYNSESFNNHFFSKYKDLTNNYSIVDVDVEYASFK
jgi:hypothetical protein